MSSFQYVRDNYGVPAKRGMRVQYLASDGDLQDGVITAGDGGYIRVRLNGAKHSVRMHPTWRLWYFDEAGNVIYKSVEHSP